MRIEYIFYTVGIIFTVATVLYYVWEYLYNVARIFKVMSLILVTLFFWFMAKYLQERDL